MEITFLAILVTGIGGYLFGILNSKTKYVKTGISLEEHAKIVLGERKEAFREGIEYMKRNFSVEIMNTPEVRALSESDEPSPPLRIIRKIDF